MGREDPHFRLRIPEELLEKFRERSAANNRSITAEIIATLGTALEQESDLLTMKSTMDDMQARLKAVEQRLFGGLISLGETKAKPPNLTKGKR